MIFKGLRLTAGRRPTWVCVGLGGVHVKLSGAYWALGGAKVGNCSASETGALYWAKLSYLVRILALGWAHVVYVGHILGPCWTYVGPMLAYVGLGWAYVGTMLVYVGPMLSHLGGYVGDMLGNLSWNILRYNFFSFPQSKNHGKTYVFKHR